jgi:HAD superfamily phosphatase (TIGR01668 family)
MKLERMIEKLLCPDLCHSHIYEVNLNNLKKKGIKGLICDLDNTLLAWDDQQVKSEVENWLVKAQELGISICILSNSLEARVNKVAKNLELLFISKAFKPRKKAFKLAINKLGVIPENVAVIGDQLFTDVYGGNRLDLLTILVEPITSKELLSTKMIRLVECRLKSYLEFKELI